MASWRAWTWWGRAVLTSWPRSPRPVHTGARWCAARLLALALVPPASSQDASAGGSSRTGTISAEDGPILITPFVGASVQVEHQGTVIHVDPWGRGDYTGAKQADLILVTDTPGDHLDPEMIRRFRKPGAPVILPDRPEEARDGASRERLRQVEDGTGCPPSKRRSA